MNPVDDLSHLLRHLNLNAIAKNNPYEKLIARKRKWTPVQMEAGTIKEGAEEVIFRALALRHMELPVGQFITDGLEKSADATRTLLEMNVDDEHNATKLWDTQRRAWHK